MYFCPITKIVKFVAKTLGADEPVELLSSYMRRIGQEYGRYASSCNQRGPPSAAQEVR